MTKEEAIYKAKHLRKVHPNICIDAEDFWETVIAALEQEPCTVTEFADRCMECGKILGDMRKDAVSRKEVMNMLHNHAFDYATSTKISSLLKTMRGEVDRMPPVTPAEKVGRWIMHIDDLFPAESTMECNKCHEHQPITIDDNYCPNCGAKMASPTGAEGSEKE